jgi:hypothetical protein
LQKHYLGRSGPTLDLHTPDNMVFINLLSDQQRDDVLAEMNMRQELLVWPGTMGHLVDLCGQVLSKAIGKQPGKDGPVGVINHLKEPFRVGEVWVLMMSMTSEADLVAYLAAVSDD